MSTWLASRHLRPHRCSRSARGLLGLLGLLGVLLTGCTAGRDQTAGRGDPARPSVRVASFDFTESRVLAEVYAGALELRGYPVSRKLGLGSREVVEPALEQDLIDLVPEYTGSLLRFLRASAAYADPALGPVGVVSGSPPAPTDSADSAGSEEDAGTTGAALAAALADRGLIALTPAPAQDRNGVVVTAAVAADRRLQRISDLAPIASRLVFGGPPECPQRPFCLVGLESTYGLRFRSFQSMPSRQVTAEALLGGEIDVGMLETTDPHLSDGRIVQLADDRRLQPAENVVPVVRRELVEHYGRAATDVLDAVSGKLSTATVIELNQRVGLAGEPADRVALDWLRGNGLG